MTSNLLTREEVEKLKSTCTLYAAYYDDTGPEDVSRIWDTLSLALAVVEAAKNELEVYGDRITFDSPAYKLRETLAPFMAKGKI